jgi:glycosyltransferase involved in cell wall biosynthesis
MASIKKSIDLPTVSIITPTYNQSNYIRYTINSVLKQDYPNIEYIVINDGSTDETKNILKEYSNKFSVIDKKNSGQSNTLNYGWSISKGEILAYISSDDILDEKCVSAAVDFLLNNPNIDIVYPDFSLIDRYGKKIKDIRTGDFDALKMSNDLICLPGPGTFFKKSVFYDLGGWDENFSYVADFDFWLRALKIKKFGKINEVLASFRVHEESGLLKKVSIPKSDEIIMLAQNKNIIDSKRALVNAFLNSAQNHLRSGRYYYFISRTLSAFIRNPLIVFKIFFWKIIFFGILRKKIYRLLNRI